MFIVALFTIAEIWQQPKCGVCVCVRVCVVQHEEQSYCNNYKWSITFKSCEPLYCTPVTYRIVEQLYFNSK